MNRQAFSDIYSPDLAHDAILHEGHPGFKEDYLILHCLLRKYRDDITRVMEIGTFIGHGTKIICNAVGPGKEVFSLELPESEKHKSSQYPTQPVGHACTLPHYQLRGDSLTFNFTPFFPLQAWYIDAEHDYRHVRRESYIAFTSGAKIIIWHDTDIPEVARAIHDSHLASGKPFEITRVKDTRITYATT